MLTLVDFVDLKLISSSSIFVESMWILLLFQILNNLFFIFLEKLCKSQPSSWGCYGACSFPKNKTTDPKSPSSSSQQQTSTPKCSCGDKNPFNFNKSFSDAEKTGGGGDGDDSTSKWRPLVLFIPLRLGLSEINSDYYPSLKVRT